MSLRLPQIRVASCCIAFAAFYALLSIARHYEYRSTALDLGIYNQALYEYAHGEGGPNTIRHVPHLLADHCEFILFILAPFYWVFGSYTLLIAQIVAVIAGGYGIRTLSRLETGDEFLSIGAMIVFFLSFGVISALIFDFHTNVVGTMFLPWMLVALTKKRMLAYYVLLGFFLSCKETLALVAIFLGISIVIAEKNRRLHGFATAFLSAVYFLIALYYIIPHFNGGGAYSHSDVLGMSVTDAMQFSVRHPFQTAFVLVDHRPKLLGWTLFLISGGILSLVQVRYALLLVPILAMKFLTNNPATWTFRFHYGIEMCMVVALGIPAVLQQLTHRWRYGLLLCFIAINVAFLPVLLLRQPTIVTNSPSSSEIAALHQATRLIPNDARVSAQDTLVAHFADRKNIYLFPETNDATYIFLDTNCCSSVYPYQQSLDFKRDVEKILRSQDVDVLFNNNGVYVLKRK